MRTRTTRQPDLRRTERRVAHPAPRARTRTGEDRVREAGGPQDLAFYRCDCGHAFADDVSTRVDCPKCGTGQAW
jgi:hypothetical protein